MTDTKNPLTLNSRDFPGSPASPILGTLAPRLRSLDAFRGMVIVLMFVVNMSYDPAIPKWFGHAGWNSGRHGQWLADYVFPWFLLIVGAAIPFSMTSGRGRAMSASHRIFAAFRRGLVIYLLGCLLHVARTSQGRGETPPIPISWGSLLHWDILPLIGLGYVVGVLVWHGPRWAWWGFVAAVLLGKWAIMPDLAATSGLDRAAWGAARTDPEASIRAWGWFGTMLTQGMPAAATVVGGMIVGEWLREDRRGVPGTHYARTAAGASIVVLLGAIMLAAFGGVPFSKDFFTPTYVLLSLGTGGLLLVAAYAALDRKGWARHRPVLAITRFFEAFGVNAIAMYLVAEFTWTLVWTRWKLVAPGGGMSDLWASYKAWLKTPLGDAGAWAAIAGYVLIYFALAAWMRRRNIIVKV
jgi:predicted acyltransferase